MDGAQQRIRNIGELGTTAEDYGEYARPSVRRRLEPPFFYLSPAVNEPKKMDHRWRGFGSFLERCFLCRKRFDPADDIFMYRNPDPCSFRHPDRDSDPTRGAHVTPAIMTYEGLEFRWQLWFVRRPVQSVTCGGTDKGKWATVNGTRGPEAAPSTPPRARRRSVIVRRAPRRQEGRNFLFVLFFLRGAGIGACWGCGGGVTSSPAGSRGEGTLKHAMPTGVRLPGRSPGSRN
ncbi:hypothetical protein EJ110_NYTH53090 [Nymphaea thermarum]|nr:hypothetical protein EJ110_NYTH53090 [Nymphaea thermarum]